MTGSADTLYTYGANLIALTAPGGVQTYYHYDGLGSVRNLSDGTGAVIANYTYGAFGDLRLMKGASDNTFQFTGEQTDDETGLIYLRARYYDPSMGRFTSKDTFPGIELFPQTLNRYTYVRNNPVNLTDPTGLLIEQLRQQIEALKDSLGTLFPQITSLTHSQSDLETYENLHKMDLLLKFANPTYRILARLSILEMARNRPEFTSLMPYIAGRQAIQNVGELAQLIPLVQNAMDSIHRARQGKIDSPELFFAEVAALSMNTINDIITGPGRAAAKLIFGEEAVAQSPVRYLDYHVTGQEVFDELIKPVGEKIGEVIEPVFLKWYGL
jgi:RHS repeat-associated protein